MDEATQDRVRELTAQLTELSKVSEGLSVRVAECGRTCGAIMEAGYAQIPEMWLAVNWHTIMNLLPEIAHVPPVAEKALKSLRSVAVCMAATHFPNAHTFLEVSQEMMDNVLKVNAIESELLSLTGETKQ